MKQFIRERQEQEKSSVVVGIVLTAAVHVVCITCLSFSGLKYIYPPPAENTFLMEVLEEEEEKVIPQYRGSQPRAEVVDRTKPIELVQKSESPYQTTAKQNQAPEATPDDFGDVDVPTPEPVINKNALFPGMSKKDTTVVTPHSATDPRAEFKAGQPDGNTDKGKTDGSVNAHLKGRNTIGGLVKPKYNVQKSGTVVVKIWVDQYGKVQKAQAGVEGTDISDKDLWNEARNAAMKTSFNMDAAAPVMQEGTITYVFKLK